MHDLKKQKKARIAAGLLFHFGQINRDDAVRQYALPAAGGS